MEGLLLEDAGMELASLGTVASPKNLEATLLFAAVSVIVSTGAVSTEVAGAAVLVAAVGVSAGSTGVVSAFLLVVVAGSSSFVVA